MRLLVTRPQPDADETAARLEALGHTAIVEPLTTIAFRPQPHFEMAPSAIAFTSSNGVRAAAKWPATAAWRAIPVFAVGDRTGAEARQAGFTDVRIAGGDLTGLVETIIEGFQPDTGRLMHVAGRDRSGDLEGALLARGLDAATVEGYAAVAADGLSQATREAIASCAVDGGLFFSRRSAAIFVDLIVQAGLEESAKKLAFLAISETAGEPLRRFGVVQIAARPDAASLVALIGR